MLVSEDITATESAQARTTCHTNFACLEDVLAVPNFGTETSPKVEYFKFESSHAFWLNLTKP